jgi:hypothetical protein
MDRKQQFKTTEYNPNHSYPFHQALKNHWYKRLGRCKNATFIAWKQEKNLQV